MTPFEEADTRLGAMHGYAEPVPFPPIFVDGQVVNHADLVNEVLGRLYRTEVGLTRCEDKLNVLAVALDALITAMKAGAIGKWTP